MKHLALVAALVLVPAVAFADRCSMTGGCVGTIGYMYIPVAQFEASDIFVDRGIPEVNATATLKQNWFYFSADFLGDPRFLPSLVSAVKTGDRLEAGGELADGAKVRILSYKGVDAPGTGATALLALIFVVSDE